MVAGDVSVEELWSQDPPGSRPGSALKNSPQGILLFHSRPPAGPGHPTVEAARHLWAWIFIAQNGVKGWRCSRVIVHGRAVSFRRMLAVGMGKSEAVHW